MKKAIVAGLLALLVTAGIAGAASKDTRVTTRYCVNVETGTSFPSYGDLNLYRGDKRVCLVGKRGKPGKNGKAGARGKAGIDGKDGTGIAGPAGAKGDTGAQGATGAQGEQGIQGETGATGAQGAQGEPGPAGATGPQGPQGEPGPPGPGANLGDLYFCVSNGSNVKYSGLTPDECDPGHDLILRVDGVEVVN